MNSETPSVRRARQREEVRERQRAETKSEILHHARQLLVDEGPAAVSLRAIAREMGMTAPGLYRYYADHRELVQALTASLYDELAAALEHSRDQAPEQSPRARFTATAHALRTWALSHKPEFALIFSKPMPDADCAPGDPCHTASWRFGGVFVGLMLEFWRAGTLPLPKTGVLDPDWLVQLEEMREHLGSEQPPLEALYVFVLAWSRLYGMVSMEVFGHLDFALTDPEPLFEHNLRDIVELLEADARDNR
ncbi:TetR/AcrR family transcriptional regulator [Streptomyces alanosinicus]|uniref:TetR family transcriptional regulator n=1 Tax=Streptomyces alanosinicus TaxID=68171 RepID=A0A918YNJ7_9ACTN|nr:TetR/AcrR family transcriptional regulator [Streptomyces alanosinicus]GHE09108.1 TetR family transcriptional regulator [Streptomyces alanosinicus]